MFSARIRCSRFESPAGERCDGPQFLGWDSNREINSIQAITAVGPRRLNVTYVRYAAHDPLCCPSLSPKTVRYRWTGTRIRALDRRPRDPGSQIKVQLRD